jgi:SAM-dependent methyltransferase
VNEPPKQNSKTDSSRPVSIVPKTDLGAGEGFVVKRKSAANAPFLSEKFPCPPVNLLKYGHDESQYLKTGKRDAQALVAALTAAGFDPKQPGNVLEFGCANGRVMRWLTTWAENGEFWGVDVDSDLVFWCHENLCPPCKFAVSTTAPGLFFEDYFFSLVYGYSVFTHIDDLFLSWICELRRIIKPGGYLFVTIIDEHAEQLQFERNRNLKTLRESSVAHQQFLAQQADFVTVGRGLKSLVTMRREYAVDIFSTGFDVVSIVENTMGTIQTALVMRRK